MEQQSVIFRQLRVGMLQTNCYLLSCQGRDDCVVIDPGAEPERIRDALEGRRAAAILLTHGHFDHIGAADALMGDDTRLYIHEADAPMLKDTSRNVSWMIGEDVLCGAEPRLLHEGDQIDAAGMSFHVLHTPGHTPGGVCYELGDDLFTGDTMFENGYGRTDLPGGSMEQMKQSLRRLTAYRQTHRIHGGHG